MMKFPTEWKVIKTVPNHQPVSHDYPMIIPRFPFITRSGSFRAPPGRHRCEWLGPHLVVWRCSLSVPGARTSSPTDLPLSRKSTDLGVSENGGTPIAGWFMSWKILLKWMIWIDLGDIPIFGHLNFFPPVAKCCKPLHTALCLIYDSLSKMEAMCQVSCLFDQKKLWPLRTKSQMDPNGGTCCNPQSNNLCLRITIPSCYLT